MEFTSLVSADGHAIEPVDLWQKRLPPKFRDDAPHRVVEEGRRYWVVAGERLERPGFDKLGRVDTDREGPQHHEVFEPKERLKAYDELGIEAEVLYPGSSGFLWRIPDPELQSAVLATYNEWLAEFCSVDRDRLLGIGLLPIHDIDAARREIRHVQDLGLRGVFIPSRQEGLRYNSRFFEPLWDAIEESGFPLSLHVAGEYKHYGWGALLANLTANLSPFRTIWPIFCFSGILDRHQGLRLVFTEGGISWLAGTLWDMDNVIHARFTQIGQPPLSAKPSEIWRRQCFATFEEDPVGLSNLDLIPYETLLWGADFPHTEGTGADTQAALERQFAKIPEHVTAAIVGKSARKVWGLADPDV